MAHEFETSGRSFAELPIIDERRTYSASSLKDLAHDLLRTSNTVEPVFQHITVESDLTSEQLAVDTAAFVALLEDYEPLDPNSAQ